MVDNCIVPAYLAVLLRMWDQCMFHQNGTVTKLLLFHNSMHACMVAIDARLDAIEYQ